MLNVLKTNTFLFLLLFSMAQPQGQAQTLGTINIHYDILTAVQPKKSFSDPKKWKWVPLFNHKTPNADRNTETIAKYKNLTLTRLAEYLDNDENGDQDFEYVSQQENDHLLKIITEGQLKSLDLISLIEEYKNALHSKIAISCLDLYKCEDGKRVLYNIYDMQARLEAIESGMIDIKMLPEHVREAFSLAHFSCYYYGFQSMDFIREYKEKKAKEWRSIFKEVSNDSNSTTIHYLQESKEYANESAISLSKNKLARVYPEDLIARIFGEGGRFMVVNCINKKRVDKWKEILNLATAN